MFRQIKDDRLEGATFRMDPEAILLVEAAAFALSLSEPAGATGHSPPDEYGIIWRNGTQRLPDEVVKLLEAQA